MNFVVDLIKRFLVMGTEILGMKTMMRGGGRWLTIVLGC